MGKKKIRILTTILAVIVFVAAAFAALSYYEKQKWDASVAKAQNYKAELEANTQTVYVATSEIKDGDTILTQEMVDEANSVDPSTVRDEETAGAVINTEKVANVEMASQITSLSADSFITEDQLGSVAIVDIPQGQPILANMVADLNITQDTREFEITAANLMTDNKENDVVDIRLVYPNGEDYVVLAKKSLKNLSLEQNDFWTYMSEDEILRFQSAVIDAYQTTGAYIYATRYVEDNLQDAATPTYLVRSETIDLMNSDPNLYEKAAQTMNASARLSLETRLGQLTEDQLSAVADGFNISDTAKGAVLSQNVDNNSAEIDSYGLDSAATSSSEDTTNSESDLNSPAVDNSTDASSAE